jgi:hypothetical protein
VGDTKGFRRTSRGYSPTAQSPKMVFLKPLTAQARLLLPEFCTNGTKKGKK